MQRYRKIQDQKKAFEFIDNQDWSSHYKSVARYRWKLRYTPENIKSRRKEEECCICYEKFQWQPNNIYNNLSCCHYKLVCKTCFKKLKKCPFCREIWKKPKTVIFRFLWFNRDVIVMDWDDVVNIVEEMVQQLYPELN